MSRSAPNTSPKVNGCCCGRSKKNDGGQTLSLASKNASYQSPEYRSRTPVVPKTYSYRVDSTRAKSCEPFPTQKELYPTRPKRRQPLSIHEGIGFVKIVNSKYPGNYIFNLEWDRYLRKRFSVGIWTIKLNEQMGVCATIHLNDDDVGVKRHFLSFFGIPVHNLSEQDFAKWCEDASMFNTIRDYPVLADLSRHHGPGSIILRGLYNKPGVMGIEMSDRFRTSVGMVRAVRFTAVNRRETINLRNYFLQSVKPQIAFCTSVSQSYPKIETDDPQQWAEARRNMLSKYREKTPERTLLCTKIRGGCTL